MILAFIPSWSALLRGSLLAAGICCASGAGAQEAPESATPSAAARNPMAMPAAHFLRPVVNPGMHQSAFAQGNEAGVAIPASRDIPLEPSMHMKMDRAMDRVAEFQR